MLATNGSLASYTNSAIDAQCLHRASAIWRLFQFYFGLRIMPGQDPANVWVGWVTPQYHSFAASFVDAEAVRKCRFAEVSAMSWFSVRQDAASMPKHVLATPDCALIKRLAVAA